MKIGVLIPTFNRKQLLMQALESVLNQSHRELDVIVIDNSSIDRATDLMASISDPRVRYLVNDHNIGMIGSINKGINLFSNEVEWCTILSDDDVLDKDFILKLVQAVVDTDAKSIIHSHRVFVDKGGNRIREARFSPREETAFDYIQMRALFKRETYLTGVMFNRKAFLAIKGYPVFTTGLATDDAFIFALTLKDRLVFDRNAIAYVRLHEGAESINSSDGLKKLQTIGQFGEYCRKVIKNNDTVDRHQFMVFDQALKRYLRALYSFWWIQTAHSALSSGHNDQEQITALLALFTSNRDNFTFRVKFAVACYQITGILPEKFAGYRSFWITISQLLRKYSQPK
jgi:glycosyltransferase involved in cell wall biosynthesis